MPVTCPVLLRLGAPSAEQGHLEIQEAEAMGFEWHGTDGITDQSQRRLCCSIPLDSGEDDQQKGESMR